MTYQSEFSSSYIETYQQKNKDKSFLRFITCGSVDDGKSTLIGRLLYDSKLIFEDHLKSLTTDSKKFGKSGQDLDLALLVDGLESEREQGITIDVAYRFFSTEQRRFMIADTPGHEQYTRNMATGASLADLAVVIIDARKGITTQTRRHSFIVSMFGVKNYIVAINKMDLIHYDQKIFQKIEADYLSLAESFDVNNIQCIPVSALYGDNVIHRSTSTRWYKGLCLIEYLDKVEIVAKNESCPFRMPVQWVNRPHQDFRGFSGTISSGAIKIGDKITVLPSGTSSTISEIVTYDGHLNIGNKGDAVTLRLKDEIDISRGDVLASAENPCGVADQFEANILWMSEKEMVPSRQYIMQTHATSAFCSLSKPKYRLDIETLEHVTCKTLFLNEFGICNIFLNQPIPFDCYDVDRELGSFILIDRLNHETVAAGMIKHSLRRSTNIHLQKLSISQAMRSAIKGQKACVVWMTGLSGAGKSTIANLVEKKLNEMGKHTMILDGDNLRFNLNRDLSFTEQDRVENLRRTTEVSKLMIEAGLIAIVATISPFQHERIMAREKIGKDKFIEVFVHAPLSVVEERDVKGLYKKARMREIPNLTGIGSPYEAPESPDLHLDTVNYGAEELAQNLVNFLLHRGFLSW